VPSRFKRALLLCCQHSVPLYLIISSVEFRHNTTVVPPRTHLSLISQYYYSLWLAWLSSVSPDVSRCSLPVAHNTHPSLTNKTLLCAKASAVFHQVPRLALIVSRSPRTETECWILITEAGVVYSLGVVQTAVEKCEQMLRVKWEL